MELIIAILGVAAALGLAALPVISPPEWADDLSRSTWIKAAVIAGLLGSAVAVAAVVQLGSEDLFKLLATVFGGALLTVVFVVSLVTDYKLRLVDRRQLNIASLVTGVFGLAHLVNSGDWLTGAVTAAMLLFAAVIYLFVFSVGASDARAVCLVATAAVPVIAWNGFLWASLGAGVYFILIGFTVAFVKRTMKSSFPAVPMLLFPYWLTLVISLFYTLPAWSPVTPI